MEPQEVEEPPVEIHLDLLVLQVPGVLHRLGADQTSPATDSPELAHAKESVSEENILSEI